MTRRRILRLVLSVLAAASALIGAWVLKPRTAVDTARLPRPASAAYEWRRVVRVIDGDTLLLDRDERVRLIGVDAPETVDPRRPVERYGKQASEFARRMLTGRNVRLEYDQTQKDRYGRTLAYVYLDDHRLLNAEIIKQGYGFAYTRFPFRYMEEFRQYERDAREARKGLWNPAP